MDRDALVERLRGVPLFSGLEGGTLERVARLGRFVRLERKSSLFSEGQPYAGMYVLLSGLAVVFKLSEDGRMLILHVVRPGDTIAEAPLVEDPPAAYASHARVTRDSELVLLPAEPLAREVRGTPDLGWALLRVLAARNRELSQQLEGVTLREVTSRLARYLLREAEGAGVLGERQPSVILPIAKGSLASYLGTVHETLSRTFARLLRQGIVRVDGPKVTILDMARLKRLA